MAGQANVLRIPNFVKARSPKRLRVLMLEVQARTGMQNNWLLSIVYNTDEKMWYAWYNEVVDLNVETGEITSG